MKDDGLTEVPCSVGDYEVLDRVGRGATGDVLKALSARGDGLVAIKRLKPELQGKPKLVERFRREFEAMRLLDHPGIVKGIDAGTDGETMYLVMEFVSGGDLSDVAPSLEPAERLSVMLQVASALSYAHESGIIHRDLKPTNVLVAVRSPVRVKLADFGVARLVLDDFETLTDSGAILGTMNFLAPEQLRGDRATVKCDIYAMGVLLFLLWSGRLPFAGPLVKQIQGRLQGAAPRLSTVCDHVPAPVDALVADMLARDPDARPQSAATIAELLHLFLSKVDPEEAAALAT